MSDLAFVYGCVTSAMAEVDDWRRFHSYNKSIISKLPDSDSYPPLIQGMCGITDDRIASWKSNVIHFGWSTKNLSDAQLSAWVQKFESLLAKLCFWEARVDIEAEVNGELHLHWDILPASIDSWRSKPPKPVNLWQFSKIGNFRGDI